MVTYVLCIKSFNQKLVNMLVSSVSIYMSTLVPISAFKDVAGYKAK